MKKAPTWAELCHLCELAMAIANDEVEIPYALIEPKDVAPFADVWCADFARTLQPGPADNRLRSWLLARLGSAVIMMRSFESQNEPVPEMDVHQILHDFLIKEWSYRLRMQWPQVPPPGLGDAE